MYWLQVQGWIKMKVSKDGAVMVTAIDYSHEALQTYQPYMKEDTHEAAAEAADADAGTAAGGGAPSAVAMYTVEVIYRGGSGAAAELFEGCENKFVAAVAAGEVDEDSGETAWTEAECASALRSYVEAHGLRSQQHGKKFVADAVLAAACGLQQGDECHMNAGLEKLTGQQMRKGYRISGLPDKSGKTVRRTS
jgi:hypothetical protein